MNPASGRIELTFTRYPHRNDITLTIQATNDPAGPWDNVASIVNGVPFTMLTGGYEVTESGVGATRSVTISYMPAAGTARRFMRITVTVP